jgi:hypothetical protein
MQHLKPCPDCNGSGTQYCCEGVAFGPGCEFTTLADASRYLRGRVRG